MKGLLYQNKGISEMVAYVLLILISIAIALIIYNVLKPYATAPREGCPSDIFVIVYSYKCGLNPSSENFVNITIKNKGLFNFTGAFVRLGNSAMREALINLRTSRSSNDPFFQGNLPPGASTELNLKTSPQFSSIVGNLNGDQVLNIEIQPAIKNGRKWTVCENSILRQKLYCNFSSSATSS